MKHLLTRLVLAVPVFAAPLALAQTGPGMMLVPWQHEGQLDLRVEGFFTPTEADVTGADVDLSILDAVGRVRLDPDSSYNPTIGFELIQYELSSADAALPDDLTDVSIAFGGSFGDVDLGETLGNWQMGFDIGLGYAGTTPFEEGEAYYLKADLFAVQPIDRDTRWLVGLNYDGNRVFLPDVPLPAVSYFARYNDEITYALGVPFSQVTWTPDDQWTIDIRSALFFSFNGRVTYQLSDSAQLFGSYQIRQDAFYISNGPDHRRFLFSQQRAEAGVNYSLTERLELVVAGGVALDQEIDVGFDTRDPAGLRDLDDSGYIRVGVVIRY